LALAPARQDVKPGGKIRLATSTDPVGLDPMISSPDSNEYFNAISHLIGAILSSLDVQFDKRVTTPTEIKNALLG